MDTDKLFDIFSSKKVAVLGDVMLDTYLHGAVHRISPEAPVPIVQFVKKENRLGGAANVALNLIALGAEVHLCSVIGIDEEADTLIELLKQNNIQRKGILQSEERKTTVKTRVLGNKQQLLRIDSEQTNSISSKEQLDLIQKVKEVLKSGVEVLIFQDYNKGILTKNVIEEISKFCQENSVLTAVDPKKNNFLSYKNVTLFKPNLKELKEGMNRQFSIENKSAFEDCVEELNDKLNNQITFVTLSERGAFISDKKEKHYIPAHIRNIADVSGAGDTVISVAALCLSAGLSLQEIGKISNLAGGLVCEEIGVVSIDKARLKEEINKLKEK